MMATDNKDNIKNSCCPVHTTQTPTGVTLVKLQPDSITTMFCNKNHPMGMVLSAQLVVGRHSLCS